MCQRGHYADELGLWLTRFTPSKRKDLKRFQEKEPFIAFREALDDLFDYAGLWQDFKLGTFHRLLTLHCQEVSAPKFISNRVF